MSDWQRYAALGWWSRVDVFQEVVFIEDEAIGKADAKKRLDLFQSQMRWALDQMLPQEVAKTGFEDRPVILESYSDLLDHVRKGKFDASVKIVKKTLFPKAELTEVEEHLKNCESSRIPKKLIEKAVVLSEVSQADAWRLEQLMHAIQAHKDLLNLTSPIEPPSSKWLDESIALAMKSLADRGIDLPALLDGRSVSEPVFALIYVKPTRSKAGSVQADKFTFWDTKVVRPPEIETRESSEEFATLTSEQKEQHRAVNKELRQLEADGWYNLSDLTTPSNRYFGYIPSHCASILLHGAEITKMIAVVLSDRRYRRGYRIVLSLMNQIAMPAREIGRHVEALNLGEAAYGYRFEKQRRESLANNNPNKKGSIKVQTLRCLECMVTILNEQQKKTGKINVSVASQFCRRGNGCGRNSAAKYRSYMKLKRERPELLEELQVEASEITPKKL